MTSSDTPEPVAAVAEPCAPPAFLTIQKDGQALVETVPLARVFSLRPADQGRLLVRIDRGLGLFEDVTTTHDYAQTIDKLNQAGAAVLDLRN